MTSPGMQELASLIRRFVDSDLTGLPCLNLYQLNAPSGPVHCIQGASLCLVAQGEKRVTLAEEEYIYDPEHFLIVSVDLPMVSQILAACSTTPYLGLRIDLDPSTIASLLIDLPVDAVPSTEEERGVSVSRIDTPLLESVLRLVRLLETPQHIPILSPMLLREITYQLLVGPQGPRLAQIARDNSRTFRIRKAIELVKENFDQPLRIESVAREVNMSVSGLHHQFKAVTAMSPIQFQKQLRLQEARRLMLNEDMDAASAGYRVGYESPSQFSREYRRQFGHPPMRDVSRIRKAPFLAAG